MIYDVNIKHNSLAVILLAAGGSERLGQPKQLVTINNESLLVRQSHLALSISEDVNCILGAEAKTMLSEVEHLPITGHINEQWQQGLSSSIAFGVSKLEKSVAAVMLLLVDQWQLREEHLSKLVKQWRMYPSNIHCVETLEENVKVIGPPVIFPSQYFASLKQLKKGDGAKKIINQFKDGVITHYMPEAFIDLDTPEQLYTMKNSAKIT